MKIYRFESGSLWIEVRCIEGKPVTAVYSKGNIHITALLGGVKTLLYAMAANGMDLNDAKLKKSVEMYLGAVAANPHLP